MADKVVVWERGADMRLVLMRSAIKCFRWWGRHKVVSLLAVLVLMVAIRLVWGWYVSRKLEKALMAIRAGGLPASMSEIIYREVPDAQNAWLLQLKAGNGLVNTNSPRNSNLDDTDPPYSAAWIKLAAASESANAASFALAHRARDLSVVQFRKSATTAAWNMPYHYVSKQLANTLADGAEYAHFNHDEGLALDRVLDVMHLARSLRQDDFLVSQLVASGIEHLSCHTMQNIAVDLGVNPAMVSSPEVNGKMRQLIAELLDERMAIEGYRHSLDLERLVMVDEYQKRADSTWFVRPLGDMETLRMLRDFDLLIAAAKVPTFPQVLDILKAIPPQYEHVQPAMLYGPERFSLDVPRYSRWFEDRWFATDAVSDRQFRALAERRATAVILAWELYRAKHGKWPEKLDQLVPDYLPAVPRDPFQGDGRAIGYLIDKVAGSPHRPMIFFDPGGRDLGVPATQMSNWNSARSRSDSRSARQYRDLTRFVPPASLKAVNN
jgi:hypothetical protein